MKRILSKLGIFAKIKSLKLPIKIGGIALILAVGLVIWQPGIVKGEFDIQAIFDRLTQHDKKIDDLEKKVDETTTIPAVQPAVTTPAPTPTKVYTASVCTEESIPFETVYEDRDYLAKGETKSFGGINGAIITCTADSDGNNARTTKVEPYSRTVYVGTWDRQSEEDAASAANAAREAESAARAAQAAKDARDKRIAQCISLSLIHI